MCFEENLKRSGDKHSGEWDTELSKRAQEGVPKCSVQVRLETLNLQ